MPGEPVTVRLPSSLDNTMFQPVATEQISNGIGPHFYAGTNLGGFARRALLAFAVSDSVPAGALIERADLTVNVSQIRESSPRTFRLHRVLTRWGEGTSDAGTGGASHGGGGGAPATPGDATWTWAVLDTVTWTAAGGDFAAGASAVASVGGLGPAGWSSTAELVADVQAWRDDPSSNFGWILLGDEGEAGTAKRFDSRESPAAGLRPELTVVYRPAAPAPRAAAAQARTGRRGVSP
jgi:hypothetical protein